MKEGKKGILRAIPMFLCVGAACCALQSFYRVSEQEQAVESMNDDMKGIVTEDDGYEYKFRILELWGEFMELIRA